MPFDGSGNFNLTDGTFTGRNIFTSEKNASQLVTAGHMDTCMNDIAGGLANTITRDGQVNNVTNLQLVATANATTGVITIGGVSFANMTGASNCFIGNAGNFTASGAGNIGIGYGAFSGAVGNIPLGILTTGFNNVAVGGNALAAVTSGTSNTAVGVSALATVSNGVTNTGIGGGAGKFITTGSQNTMLGDFTGNSLTTGSSNICIGYGADVNSAPASGQINVACTIFGTGCTATGASPGTGKIGINNQAPTYELECGTGDFGIATAGKTIRIKEGTNAKMGTATLVGGTLVVNTTAVTNNSRIFLTCQTPGGTPGFLRVSARTAGTSFTILSSSGTDTSVVAWMIVEPY